MSNESFHGYQYLVDAKDSRQYAVRFDHGEGRGVKVYADDERKAHFKPNETVYAFNDEIEHKFENGKLLLETQAWQITTDASGKPNSVLFSPVTFEAKFRQEEGGTFKLYYGMTKESREELSEMDFDEAFPKLFSEAIDANDPGLTPTPQGMRADPAMLSSMAFPPHHAGGAAIARINNELTATENTAVMPRPQDTVPTRQPATPAKPRASTDFSRASTDVPTPPEKLRVPDAALESVIRQYCQDFTARAEAGRLDPVVGRDEETDQALKVLSRRKQASLCFTGDAGVGKTAMFAGVAQRLASGENVPESLRGARVLQLDLQAMNAGAKFRGQFEEKLKPLIDGLQERQGYFKGRKIIIAIDEIHSQLTAGKAEGGSDAGNMMKPFLTSQGISVMGTTTGEEYRKHIEKDPALASRFEQMVLGEPDAAATLHILKAAWPNIKSHHKLAEDLAEDDFEYIVTITNRYAPNESQPRKGEKVLDMAGASAQFRGSNVIEREDIISAVAQMSKLSVDFLSQGDHERFLKMETELPQKVLGQPGIQKVIDGLVGARSGLNDPNQPWGCFVLQGPTGTGKTELAKEVARYLFGTDEAMTKLDMSEYSEKHTVSRLIGAPPGFVGFDSAEPALTERIRQRPYQVLLLDEIEKAHPDVFNVLLSILNDGKMQDNQGKTVLFNNVIILMTTNLGASQAMAMIQGKAGMTFGNESSIEDPAAMQEKLGKTYASARAQFFRPEMINRIEELGGFVTFVPLVKSVIEKLVDREVEKVGKRISDASGAGLKGVTLEVSDEIREKLTKEGYNPSMGARPMRKVVREQLANPLGKWLMGNKADVVKFAAENGGARIVVEALGAGFKPVLLPAQEVAPAATVSNDNATKPARTKKPKGPTAA